MSSSAGLAGARASAIGAFGALTLLLAPAPAHASGHGGRAGLSRSTVQLGRRVLVRRISGRVSVRAPGERTFHPLHGSASLPDGGEIDTTHGAAEVTVAAPAGGRAAARVSEGRARIDQLASGVTVFALTAPLSGCARAAAAFYHSRHGLRSRQLLVSEHGGEWDTQGRYVSTSVEGTRWLTRDECNRSTVEVIEGVVTVHDLVHHTTTLVAASQSYTAAPAAAGAFATTFLDTVAPSSTGGDVTPGVVQVNGATYQHGIQMEVGLAQETDEATYPVPPGAKTFTAVVGNDDNQTNQFWEQITLLFEVFVDGRRAASAHAQGHTSEPLPAVPVAGAKTIRLLVTNLGDNGGGTRADWAEPVLR